MQGRQLHLAKSSGQTAHQGSTCIKLSRLSRVAMTPPPIFERDSCIRLTLPCSKTAAGLEAVLMQSAALSHQGDGQHVCQHRPDLLISTILMQEPLGDCTRLQSVLQQPGPQRYSAAAYRRLCLEHTLHWNSSGREGLYSASASCACSASYSTGSYPCRSNRTHVLSADRMARRDERMLWSAQEAGSAWKPRSSVQYIR